MISEWKAITVYWHSIETQTLYLTTAYLTRACKYAVSQTLGSLHIFTHTSDTRVTARLYMHLMCAWKRAVIQLPDVFK